MRIRKGHRCLPLAPADRSSLQEGFVPGDKNARRVVNERKDEVNQASPPLVVAPGAGAVAAPVVAATSGTTTQEDLDLVIGTSSGGTERLEVDRDRKRLSADGYSRKRPAIVEEGVLSISSIIRAGVGSARSNSASAPASAQSVVSSVLSLTKSRTDCSPSIAMNTIDQPNLLLQSLKRVCSASENTGLTAKEAVAKILEQGLPGLIEGGERLIVQVAKLFRSSSAFVEREERGRYFVQESTGMTEWDTFHTGDSNVRREKAVPSSAASETEKAIEAATQLQNLQRTEETVGDRVGFTRREEISGADRRVATLRGKSGVKASSPQKASLSRDQSGPRCNRDDGKGWRCFRPAESGFSLCKYHRDQIRRAEIRRRKVRNKSKEQSPVSPVKSVKPVKPSKPSNPTHKEVKAVSVPDAEVSVDANSMDSDDELPDHKRRRFVKAKSLKSIM